jgi:flagellar hook assembly protein FlgD
MKKNLLLSTILVAQITTAQEAPPKAKEAPQAVVPQHLSRKQNQLEGVNEAWLKNLQQQTKEYWLKRMKPSLPNDPIPVQPILQSKKEDLSKTVSPSLTKTVVQEIPFASKNNTIELSVENSSGITASNVRVQITDISNWLVFSSKDVQLGEMSGNAEKSATFTFSVDKFAPVGKEQSLTVTVKSSSGQSWTREIRVKVSPPEKFELYQNYPNPFNPTTTIAYQLSAESKVSLKVYDILGREVRTLVDGQQQAGYHQEVFDASRLASGVYVYRIVYANTSDKQRSTQKTMLLLK